MAQGRCTLQIWLDGRWRVAGEVRCADDGAGFGSPSTFEYDFDYLDAVGAHLEATDHRAVSCRYPVGYQAHAEERWPAFLLDVIPSGAARRAWAKELGLPNNAGSDWAVLVRGDPATELLELLRRDVADVALGNTDNHARNTAVLKDPRAGVALAPVYDLAPMVLDPQGIVRVCRWAAEDDGYPRWAEVVDVLVPLGLDGDAAKTWLREVASAVGELPRTMRDLGVPDEVRVALANRTARVARALEAVR